MSGYIPTVLAPCLANSKARHRPIPRLAPVISTVSPLTSFRRSARSTRRQNTWQLRKTTTINSRRTHKKDSHSALSTLVKKCAIIVENLGRVQNCSTHGCPVTGKA
ncbi:hypothetical protein Bbelb_178030 [Branchiostoma belcheri]|nr:hypothetical protein Bbelb_178030 [Branchiostoma belcheri]